MDNAMEDIAPHANYPVFLFFFFLLQTAVAANEDNFSQT